MKYLFVRMSEGDIETKVTENIEDFKDFNPHLDGHWEKLLHYINTCISAEITAIPIPTYGNSNIGSYFILWDFRDTNFRKDRIAKNKKELIDCNLGHNGFDVMLVRDLHYDEEDWDEKFDIAINDESRHEIEFFDSYSRAESYLINKLTGDNDFYYGLINYFRYKSDEENFGELGECEEYMCIGEAWAEEID